MGSTVIIKDHLSKTILELEANEIGFNNNTKQHKTKMIIKTGYNGIILEQIPIKFKWKHWFMSNVS